MWGKIMIPMYWLWLHGLYGLHGPWCPLSKKAVNSLWPSDAMCQHRSGSPLAQVMAWCLTAPSHYLNQCWLIIRQVSSLHLRATSQTPPPPITKISLKITYLKLHWNLPGANGLNLITHLELCWQWYNSSSKLVICGYNTFFNLLKWCLIR